MPVYFVFLDGVGLGPDRPDVNPLVHFTLPTFARLAGGQPWTQTARRVITPTLVFRPLDATLGIEGLPQSGTGQATLFTGVNCAAVAGRHFGPYPHSQTRPVLATHNLFRRIQERALPVPEPAAFANAYPPRFFELVRKRDRWTVTTRCCLEAGLRIRTLDDLRAGRALAADLTGAGLRDGLGHALTPITEEEAGRRLARLGRAHALTLFEYFLTDKAGHQQDMAHAGLLLQRLDRFFASLLDALDPDRDLLLITSDHGNLEDLTTRTHTRHAVPLVAWGRGADRFQDVNDLTGVTPALVDAVQDLIA